MKPIELQSLILNEKEDFLIVIKCDSNKILYVSDTCSNSIGFNSVFKFYGFFIYYTIIININVYTKNELIDKNFLEFIHNADQKQVSTQLSLQENSIILYL